MMKNSHAFAQLDAPIFKESVLEQLFEYILLDDVPHPQTLLPQDALPKCTEEEIEAAYKLSWQLLKRGVDFARTRKLVLKIAITGKATEEERLEFKYMRAKFKHMRFACLNFDKKHLYPFLPKFFTLLLGNMQDSFKNHHHLHTFLYGVIILMMMTPPALFLMMRSLCHFTTETPEGLLKYHQEENKKLASFLKDSASITGHEFHKMRKLISRRTAFNDTLRTIRPSENLNALSQYLATMNGMMGDEHDMLVEKKLKGEQDYHGDQFSVPAEITRRVTEFLTHNKAL